MEKEKRKQIVIVGAGFGGVHAYLTLHKLLHGRSDIDIHIVNPTDHFTFIPMIHEVATGTLRPSSITQPLRTLPRCCLSSVIEGRATQINCENQTVVVMYDNLEETQADDVPEAQKEKTISYDYLVLAMGSETNFFTVPGAQEYGYELKTLEDAIAIKNRVIEQFQAASRFDNLQAQEDALRFVVVGNGATGVELTGELADLINVELAKGFPLLADRASVVIIGRGNQLMKPIDPWFGKRAEEILRRKGSVSIMHDTSVTEVKPDGVETTNGFVKAGTVIWTAGVKARGVAFDDQHINIDDRTKRMQVNGHLHLPRHKSIFVVGDQAWTEQEEGVPYPMRAQFAVRQGQTAARNIVAQINGKEPEEFEFKEKGMIISIGTGGSLAKVGNIKFSGPFGWFIYRVVYLMGIVGWRAKLRAGLEWGLNLFLPRDISKL